MTENILTAGVARIDITPPLGLRMQGVLRRVEGAVGIDSHLLATALVLADDDMRPGTSAQRHPARRRCR